MQVFENCTEIPEEPWLPLCSPLPLAALPAVLLLQPASTQAGGRCVPQEWPVVPCLPQKPGASRSRAFLLLPAVCHSVQEATRKESFAFLGSSISSENLS